MKRLFNIVLFLALPLLTFGQVVKTAAVPYTKGASPYTPNIASSSEVRIDTSCSCAYWWDRDNLTWMRLRPGPDVITGGSAPAYTPRDNQSLFAVNADSELYYYNGSTWSQIGGGGAGGIYGGSGSVPDGTVASLVDDFEFSGPDISSFTVTTGTSRGGQYFQNFTGATVAYRDTSGNSTLQFTSTGALFNFADGTTDRLTIGDRDARYSADYSATYSDRSLPDVGWVNGQIGAEITTAVSIPNDEIAFGNASSDGIESDAALKFTTPQLLITETAAEAKITNDAASSSTGGGLLTLAALDGTALGSGHRVGYADFLGSTGAATSNVAARIEVTARSAWNSASSPSIMSFQTANVGGLTLHEKARILSNSFGTSYSLELRDRTRLDFFNTGNTANGRIEVTDSSMYILPPSSIGGAEFQLNGKVGFSVCNAPTLSADRDNWFLGTACGIYLLTPTGADRNISGMQASMETGSGRIVWFYNSSATFNVIFLDASGSSSAANQFDLADGDYTLAPGNAVAFLYVEGLDRWVLPNRPGTGGASDHGALTGLSDDDHSQYLLLNGRATGQIAIGGTAANDDLTLNSTSNATKGDVFIQSAGGNVTVGGGATASEIKLLEPSGSGMNYTSIKAGAQAGDVTYTLPPAAPTSNGQVLSSSTAGVTAWIEPGGSGAVSTIRPTAIAATTNDYNPTGYSTTRTQYMEVTGDSLFRTITGLTAATRDGVTKTFANTSRFCYILAKEHTGSSAANRFKIQRDIVMFPGMEATLRYDSINAYWRLVNTNKSNVRFASTVEASMDMINASTANGIFQHNTSGGTSTTAGANATDFIKTSTLTTGAVATSFPSLAVGTNVVHIDQNNTYFRVSGRAKVSALSTAAEDYDFRIGFKNSVDTVTAEGAEISYQYQENSGGFTLKTHDGSTPNTVNAGGPVIAATYYTLELIYYPYGEVTAFINGVRYTTTSNLPAAIAVSPFIMMDKDNGATTRTATHTNFEYFGCYVK